MQVINIAPKGANILPIGVEINPAVILVNPQGLAVWVSTAGPGADESKCQFSSYACCRHLLALRCFMIEVVKGSTG